MVALLIVLALLIAIASLVVVAPLVATASLVVVAPLVGTALHTPHVQNAGIQGAHQWSSKHTRHKGKQAQ